MATGAADSWEYSKREMSHEEPAPPLATRTRPLRVGLLGPYASANLGDTSIQMAVMQALRERLAPVSFLGISTDPADVVRTHGIAAFAASGEGGMIEPGRPDPPETGGARRWLPGRIERLRGIDRVAASLDLLIISGSGQIDDFWGGPWGQPFRLLAWSGCARRHRVPVAVLGVGVDELDARLSGWFAVRAMHLACYRAFRDAGSVDVLRALGMSAPSRVCPDPAFGLRLPATGPRAGHDRPYAVISPIARNAWPGSEDAEYETYLQSLAGAAEGLLGAGLDVRFACSQTRMDPPAAQRVASKMARAAAARCTQEPIVSVDDYLAVTGPARLVVASRLHAAILALVAGAPVVAIAEARKVRQLMADVGLSEWFMGLHEAQAPAVWAKVQAALARQEGLREHVGAQQRSLRASLAATYDELVAAVTPGLLSRNRHTM